LPLTEPRSNWSIDWDVTIVGQGLAGTALAWALIERGQRVQVLDAGEAVTSSKIAAGLMTPITGMRLAPTVGFDAFLAEAAEFYRGIEARTGTSFYHNRLSVRLFRSDAERRIFAQRQLTAGFQRHLVTADHEPLRDAGMADSSGGGFAMRSAQLDSALYLAASRAAFSVGGHYADGKLDWQNDVAIADHRIAVRGQTTRWLISCEGYAARLNPYFAEVPFNAAKGEILTLRFDGPQQSSVPPCMPPSDPSSQVPVLHRGIWLAPSGQPNVFRAGSTYDLKQLDQQPTASARAHLERQLAEFCDKSYAVLDHQAAVRPILAQNRVLTGVHSRHARLGYFNGLGSKGALYAPWYARRFAAYLTAERTVQSDADGPQCGPVTMLS
jgi:glycine oxidase